MDAPQFSNDRFLICEGIDDKQFLTALVKKRRLPEFQICHAAEFNGWGEGEQPIGGKSGIPKSLYRIDVLSGFDSLKALLIVTDNDHQKSWKELRKSLKGICTLPETPVEIGLIYGKPLAIFLIPSAAEYGDLETYCLPEVHRKWPRAESCVNTFLDCTGASMWEKKASKNKAKFRAATVGFYQPDPFKGLGYRLGNEALSADNPRFDELAQFLKDFDSLVGIRGGGFAPPFGTSPKNGF